jgi:hypothetical protein
MPMIVRREEQPGLYGLSIALHVPIIAYLMLIAISRFSQMS